MKYCPTVCVGQNKITAEPAKRNCQNRKKQLPYDQKTTAEPAKNNCRKIKTQLPKSQKTTDQQKTNAEKSKSDCRIVKRQLPECQKTTAELSKDNCRRVGQFGSLNLNYCVRRAAQNHCPTGKKQQPRKIITAELAKHNYRKIKKQLPNRQKTTAEQ